MAIPSGNMVITDKIPISTGASSAMPYPRQWFADERDVLISWVKSEFAAANAIIDFLCHHLRVVGDPGEYDVVFASIEQRRSNWYSVINLQQYFPIGEVVYELQQVAWRRQMRRVDHVKSGGKDFRSSVGGVHGNGSRQGQRFGGSKGNRVSGSQMYEPIAALTDTTSTDGRAGEKGDGVKPRNEVQKTEKAITIAEAVSEDTTLKSSEDGESKDCEQTEDMAVKGKERGRSDSQGTGDFQGGHNSSSIIGQDVKENCMVRPITFNAMERCDGKMVNVAEGMNLYDKLLDQQEVSGLVSLVNEMKAAGKKLQGETYVVSKRPMKGHGREIIQLGCAAALHPEDDDASGTSKERSVEPVPNFLQDLINRLASMNVMTMKPDSCVIDIFNEGDFSLPHPWPRSFGSSIYILPLEACEMVFGNRSMTPDGPGDFKGSLRLSLAPGCLLAVQGKSVELAKRAIPSSRKQRMLITLAKFQSRTTYSGDSQRIGSYAAQATNRSPVPSRSHNNLRPRQYPSFTSTCMLPAPPIHPQIPPPSNAVPPLFTPSVATARPFTTSLPLPPGSVGWGATASSPPLPHLPVPGTGVFLPPGSSNASAPQLLLATEVAMPKYNMLRKMENGTGNGKAEPKSGLKMQRQDCNGDLSGTDSGKVVSKEEEQQIAQGQE